MSKKTTTKGAAAADACAVCGGRQRRSCENYFMTLTGEWGVTLEDATVIRCENCARPGFVVRGLAPLVRTIAAAVAAKKGRLAPVEITYLRKHIDYTGTRLARAMGVTPQTVSRWEHGREPIGPQADRLLRALVILADHGEARFDVARLEAIEDGPGVPLRLTLRQDQGGEWEAVAA